MPNFHVTEDELNALDDALGKYQDVISDLQLQISRLPKGILKKIQNPSQDLSIFGLEPQGKYTSYLQYVFEFSSIAEFQDLKKNMEATSKIDTIIQLSDPEKMEKDQKNICDTLSAEEIDCTILDKCMTAMRKAAVPVVLKLKDHLLQSQQQVDDKTSGHHPSVG